MYTYNTIGGGRLAGQAAPASRPGRPANPADRSDPIDRIEHVNIHNVSKTLLSKRVVFDFCMS